MTNFKKAVERVMEFLDWYWLCKKNAAIRRINVNKYKLSRLAEVEDTPTPEMIAIVDKVSKDVDFVKSYVIEEELEEDIAHQHCVHSACNSFHNHCPFLSIIFTKTVECVISKSGYSCAGHSYALPQLYYKFPSPRREPCTLSNRQQMH